MIIVNAGAPSQQNNYFITETSYFAKSKSKSVKINVEVFYAISGYRTAKNTSIQRK